MKVKNPFAAPSQPAPDAPVNSSNIPYEAFGYIPDIAQEAQAAYYPNPHLNPQPYFSQEDYAVANWFTTRVHLSPLGKAITNDAGK